MYGIPRYRGEKNEKKSRLMNMYILKTVRIIRYIRIKEFKMSSTQLRTSSVNQTLEVLTRFWSKYSRSFTVDRAHIEAIKEVSQGWNVTQQTIWDLNCRRLGLETIQMFRNLLEKWVLGDPKPLIDVLKRNTIYQNRQEIIQFFKQDKFKATIKSSGRSIPQEKVNVGGVSAVGESFSFQLQPDTAKKVKVLALVDEMSTADWLANAIPEVIEKKYAAWLEKQR